MNDRSIHPNTKILLDAWRRMNAHTDPVGSESPRVTDHPGLIDRLFVLEHKRDGAWLFRNAGGSVSSLMGRQLVDHDFLNLWTGPDRPMMSAFLEAVQLDGAPGVIRGRGETLTGQRVELELTLMPLAKQSERPDTSRLLGLYQTLGGEPMLKGRPVWRHRISMLVPPDTRVPGPQLKLVASNG
ncbi:MAG TPA: PAS domain-containing protein [Hyphomonas sp.]|nr:PAS domain-containing protein [Hyphomonas sp.]